MNTTTSPSTGEVWLQLASLVLDNRDGWRAEVATTMGMPFSRYRALRRCEAGPLTATTLARQLDVDAPAASLVVTDLCHAGLVERTPDPEDARRKIITITDEGRTMLHRVREETSIASLLEALSVEELHSLARLVDKLHRAGDQNRTGASR